MTLPVNGLTAVTPLQERKLMMAVKAVATAPQVECPMDHYIHAGMYVRRVTIPAGVTMVSCKVKVPTMIFINGHVAVTNGEDTEEVNGFAVFRGEAGRRAMWYAHERTEVVITFPTTSTSVDEAEKEFTDEWEFLQNHQGEDR